MLFPWIRAAEDRATLQQATEALRATLESFQTDFRELTVQMEDLEHKWDLSSETLSSLADRVHRELGHVARLRRQSAKLSAEPTSEMPNGDGDELEIAPENGQRPAPAARRRGRYARSGASASGGER